jgi:hypothetical protein
MFKRFLSKYAEYEQCSFEDLALHLSGGIHDKHGYILESKKNRDELLYSSE